MPRAAAATIRLSSPAACASASAIAMSLLQRPELLIADEITTALDVTLEAQILHLLRELRTELNGSILFISHNLGAIAEVCDSVVVLYAGEVVEQGPVTRSSIARSIPTRARSSNAIRRASRPSPANCR